MTPDSVKDFAEQPVINSMEKRSLISTGRGGFRGNIDDMRCRNKDLREAGLEADPALTKHSRSHSIVVGAITTIIVCNKTYLTTIKERSKKRTLMVMIALDSQKLQGNPSLAHSNQWPPNKTSLLGTPLPRWH